MNALVATKAKVNRSLVAGRGRGAYPESQKSRGQQINDFLMRVAGCVRSAAMFVMQHGGRSGGERCSC